MTKNLMQIYNVDTLAAMAELADALDSGSSRGNSVKVRLLLAAYTQIEESIKRLAIVANGPIGSPEILRPLIQRHSRVIAVDGGLVHCNRLGIQPDLFVGDCDSCPPSLLKQYPNLPTVVLERDKDETDLEVAIREAGEAEITLYGAWGNRMDHSLTNALLLVRYPGIEMETETETALAIHQTVQLNCFRGQTLSLIPIYGPAMGIDTRGLKWELKEGKLDQHFIGISNTCLKEEVEISVKQGSLLCLLLRSPIV